MPEVASINAALERIKAGCHTDADLGLLRQAVASGQRSVAIGGNAEGNVIVTGDGNSVTVQGASADVLRKVLEDIQSHATLDPRARLDRSRMLQRVRSMWIDGYLEDSLHGAALQALGLEERSEAVPDRWHMVLQQPDRPTETLAPDTHILEVFDRLDGEILILGEPGSGKTMTLLELARALLDRAEQDEALPMPIVFPLSSWAAKRLPLTDWLKDELNLRYDIPRSIGQRWVEDDRILPLLDGLDEVAADCRAASVEAINTYLTGRSVALSGLVVTSRVADYVGLARLVRLRGAVLLQALRPEQIDAYLASAGEQLAGVRLALPADAVLRELARSPLLLSTITLAYQGVPAEAISMTGTIEERRGQLFATYVERMFARRDADTRFSREKTLHWLGWLARALNGQTQTIFYLEGLQPDWLPTRAACWWYTVVDRLGFAVTGGLCLALILGFAYGPTVGVLLGLVTVSALGLFGGTSNVQSWSRTGPHQDIWGAVCGTALGWLVVGLPTAIVVAVELTPVATFNDDFGLCVSGNVCFFDGGDSSRFAWLLVGALLVPLGGVASGLAAQGNGAPSLRPRQIIPVENLGWSASKATRSAITGAAGGLGLGFILGLAFALSSTPGFDVVVVSEVMLGIGLIFGLPLSLTAAAAGLLLGGLAGRQVDPAARALPNQGIWRSARTALIVGLTVALICGLLVASLVREPLIGLVFGLVFGLAYGGYACLSHCALRFVLWREGVLPLKAVRFLDYATERIFMRRVGGGYIFVHRLLQEYFAGQAISALTDTQAGAG